MNLFKIKKNMIRFSIGSFIATTLFLLGINKDNMIILAIILAIGNIVFSIVHCKEENLTELINAALVSRLSVVMISNAIFNVYSIIHIIVGIFVLPVIVSLNGNIFTIISSYLVIIVMKICVDILGSPYIVSYFVAAHKAGIGIKKNLIHVLLQLIPCVNIMDTIYLKIKNNNWSNKNKKIFSIIAGLLLYSILFVFSIILLFIQGAIN